MPGKRSSKPASTPLSPWAIIGTAGIALAVFVALLWLAIVAPHGIPGRSYRYINAQFKTAGNVPISSEVRVAGLNAGQVTKATLNNGIATLRLQLRSGTGTIYKDATARIGLKGLLGGKYVEIDPGKGPERLPDNAVLPTGKTASAVDLVDAIQAFDDPTRKATRAFVNGLGGGLTGRGEDINGTLYDAPSMWRNLRTTSDAILARQGAAARLFGSLDDTADAFDPVRDTLAAGFRPESSVLETIAGARPDVQRTLEVAPGALNQLNAGLSAATPLLTEVAGLARTTVRFSRPAPEALRRTAQLLHDADPALKATSPLLATLRTAVPPTLRLLTRLNPVIPPATKVLSTSIAPLAALGKRPCDLGSFARNWRSMMGFGVAGSGNGLASDNGLGSLNSVRLFLASPQPPDTLPVDTRPTVSVPSNAYPAACQAASEYAR